MTNNQLKEALDRRYAALEASPERRARILAAAGRQSTSARGGKVRLTLVLAMVALLALGSAGVAAGINLFTRMAEQNEELGRVADMAAVTNNPTFIYENEETGRMESAITNAYYDGQILQVGYYAIIEGGVNDFWKPSEEEKAKMTRIEENPYEETLRTIQESGVEMPDYYVRLLEAMEKGTEWSWASRAVSFSDSIEANGISLKMDDNWFDIFNDGQFQIYEVIEYVHPLPDTLVNQDSLQLEMPVFDRTDQMYFDGKDWFSYTHAYQVGALTATVSRTSAE